MNPKPKLNTDINNEKDRSQKVKLYETSFITYFIYCFYSWIDSKGGKHENDDVVSISEQSSDESIYKSRYSVDQ